jgi:hypothetical protein
MKGEDYTGPRVAAGIVETLEKLAAGVYTRPLLSST